MTHGLLSALQSEEPAAFGCRCQHERPQGLGRGCIRAGAFLQHLRRAGNHGNITCWLCVIVSVGLHLIVLTEEESMVLAIDA